MIGIYKIINPKGKVYIGQSMDIHSRIKHYKNNNGKRQPKIYYSLKKYGWENHTFEIIEECSIEKLNEREIFWKKYYLEKNKNNWNKVLFCELYDNGGGPLTQETKRKMSEKKKGIKLSKITCLKISNSKKGTKHSEKTISKMKKDRIGKTNSKPVLQYDLGEKFIKEWVNGRQASLKLNICYSHINKILNNQGKSAGGFIWKFKIN